MRRWFRRTGKEHDRDGEKGTAPLVEETEPGPEAAEEEAVAVAGPEAPEAAPPHAETESVPEKRGGLFRRWRREPQPEETAPPRSEEYAAEPETGFVEPASTPAPAPPLTTEP